MFQTQGSGRKRVVVATEQIALASLNLRTGEICKRTWSLLPSIIIAYTFFRA